MRHIDIFSGIGGFALAAREVWKDQYENVLFCDNNKFCQEVLKKNFGKDVLIYDDIRDVVADPTDSRIKGMQGMEDEIFLLTGGFPCQPFSCAGKRRGTEDNRYLWPEMLRVIREFKPTWVVAENVRGLLTINEGMVFEQVCLDLEREGYEVQPFIIPAVAVNAPHRRDRVWIVANRPSERSDTGERDRQERQVLSNQNRDATQNKSTGQGRECGIGKVSTDASNACHIEGRTEQEIESSGETRSPIGEYWDFSRGSWNQNWLEVATELCGVDDGLPVELDGFKLTKAGHRVERLKALGNAIVPQVAVEIFRAISITACE